jgi:hypothetical protein
MEGSIMNSLYKDPLKLVPDEPLEEAEMATHVASLASDLSESLNRAATQALLDWSAQTGMAPNAFMRDALRRSLFATFVGFLDHASAPQLTTDHVEDYFKISTNKVPPSKNTPDPVEG